MFGRLVTMKLKANSVVELPLIMKNDVLPLLRKQKGFRDEITFVAPERSLAVAISLWDTTGDAEAYNRTGYPAVMKCLSTVVEGTPTVGTAEVSNSTFHKIAAAQAA